MKRLFVIKIRKYFFIIDKTLEKVGGHTAGIPKLSLISPLNLNGTALSFVKK